MNTQREQLIYTWLTSVLENDQFKIAFLAGDASFRRYARIELQNKTYMLMDAPPEKEDCVPFVTIASFLRAMAYVCLRSSRKIWLKVFYC